MSKPVCGFFAPEGRPWEEGLAHQFASRCQVEGQPLCFRVHVWDRDWPEAEQAIQWATAHGMTPYISITDPGVLAPQAVGVDATFSYSWGNGHNWEAAAISAPHIQDDSGPVGAMKIMLRRGVVGTPMLFHAYGQSGFVPSKMLPILKEEADKREIELIWSECHWGFPGKDKNMGDRPDVTSAEGGAWCRRAAADAEATGIPLAIYTPKYFFDASHEPNAAGRVFFGYEEAKPLRAPKMKAWWMGVQMRSA